MVKEPPMMQEMGPKKYGEHIRKQNAFYDKYKAGKRDPKTGEYYHKISTTDPRKPKVVYNSRCTSFTIGHTQCEGCGEEMSVGSNSMGKCCLYCGTQNFFSTELKEKLLKEYEENNDNGE